MKKRGKFSEIATDVLGIIRRKNGSIYDVELMIQLDFTPDSWKAWRPQFIQIFSLKTFSYTDSDGEEHNYQIGYNKKERKWEEQIIVLE